MPSQSSLISLCFIWDSTSLQATSKNSPVHTKLIDGGKTQRAIGYLLQIVNENCAWISFAFYFLCLVMLSIM